MTKISATLGGGKPFQKPGLQGARNPQSQAAQRPVQHQAALLAAEGGGIDWEAPENATPGRMPKQHFGARTEEYNEVPQLRERMIRVRSKPHLISYSNGLPIPNDHWVTLPVSAGIMKAIAEGDLEQGDPVKPGERPSDLRNQHPRRHHADATPPRQNPPAE